MKDVNCVFLVLLKFGHCSDNYDKFVSTYSKARNIEIVGKKSPLDL